MAGVELSLPQTLCLSLDYFHSCSNPECDSYALRNKGTEALTGPELFPKVLGTNMYLQGTNMLFVGVLNVLPQRQLL